MRRSKKLIKAAVAAMLIAFALPIPGGVHAEEFPVAISTFMDAKFNQYVQRFDTNNDGELSEEEANLVTEINVAGLGVESLEGIEHFHNLQELDCSGNRQLTRLYVGANTKLTNLNCSNCGLVDLWLGEWVSSAFDEIDGFEDQINAPVNSGPVGLKTLDCSNNNLTNISDLDKLTALQILYCERNKLTSLDVSANTNLHTLDCAFQKTAEDVEGETAYQPGVGLTALTLGNNNKLKKLQCECNALTSLDVSENTGLEKLGCSDNLMSSLDVSTNILLYDFSCNNNKLTSLDVRSNKALEYLGCSDNFLTSLDVSANKSLGTLFCDGNRMTSLDLRSNTALESINCGYCANLNTLLLPSDERLKSVFCYSCELISLDVSVAPGIEFLSCGKNKITTLDLRKNKKLSDNIGKKDEEGYLYVEYDKNVKVIKYGEALEEEPKTNVTEAPAAPKHTVVPSWVNYRGNIVATDANGKVLKETGVVTWRGYNILLANGVVYKKTTFYRDKVDGKWKLFQNGLLARTGNTFVYQYGKLLHVNNGVLDTTDGFVKYNGKFVYSYHGMAATSYTGWVKYDKYKCYLVKGVLTKITR